MSEQENLVQNTRTMPLVALRNMLLFPGAEIQFDVASLSLRWRVQCEVGGRFSW